MSPARRDLDRLLDQFEQSMLNPDATALQTALAGLWDQHDRVPEAVVDRLIAGRAIMPLLAMELLAGFAGERAPALLRRVSDSAEAPDIVRWGARRRAGWPRRGEARQRLAFLLSLRDPDETLVQAIVQGGSWWPPNAEILQEVLAYLLALPRERRLSIVRRAVNEGAPNVVWLLRALLHVADLPLQRYAVGELVRLRDPAARGALNRLALTARSDALRQEAQAAQRRLDMIGAGSPDRAAADLPEWPPLVGARVTCLDGDGGQALVVTRGSPDQTRVVVDVFHKERWGIKDVLGVSQSAESDIHDQVAEWFGEIDLPLVDVDAAAVRGILADAVGVNAATRHAIPPHFELWEPLVHDAYPPAADEPVTHPELDDAPFAHRKDLVRRSSRLFDNPFFAYWFFNPDELSPALDDVPPPGPRGMTDEQYRPLIQRLITPDVRARIRRRLRRQAWLLDRAGHRRQRDLALATAASLKDATSLPDNPFLRGMIDLSVVNLLGGLLRPVLDDLDFGGPG